MCFNLSITKYTEYLEKRFSVKILPEIFFSPVYHASAFTYPKLPVITSGNPEFIDLFNWGLIPFWIKSKNDADSIRSKTINAKAETVFEKPSFKDAVIKRRCLVLTDGFFEFHTYNGKKYPFYIRMKDNDSFALAGICELWKNPENNSLTKTFSILTEAASPLLAKIHNEKKRMPVIIKKGDEKKWISDIGEHEIKSFFNKPDESILEAYPVSRLLVSKNTNSNIPAVLEKFDYPELNL